MNFAISIAAAALAGLIATAAFGQSSPLRERVLRTAAIDAGLAPVDQINAPFDAAKAAVGEHLFAFEGLSLNASISCRSCHLPQFSSADGLPNAVGVGGEGEGPARLKSGGKIVPRNALPLWGRGGKGFNTLFWDGKVRKDKSTGAIISQFGASPPSDDPLAVAAHLPFVEFREMIDDERPDVRAHEAETVEAASGVYDILLDRILDDATLSADLAAAFGKKRSHLAFSDAAEAVANFIRREFRLRETKFHRFVFKGESLSESELRGGLVFYGKGRCASCHNGPFFSDLAFHAIPFPQAGFGKNGFGVDYGRYNVTFDPEDVYKFRTPPLYNVEHTAPYAHSGSVSSLEAAIWAHVDPLRGDAASENSSTHERQEFYRRLQAWSKEGILMETITEKDVSDLTAFMKTLSFCRPDAVQFCEK